MPYRLGDARNNDISDRESLEFLSEKYDYDYAGAKAAGIADQDIINEMTNRGYIDREYDILGGIKDIGNMLYDVPTQLQASFAAALEPDDPYAEHDWRDRWREAGKARTEMREEAPGGEAQFLPPIPGVLPEGIKRSDIREASGNIGFSGVALGGGVLGGVVGGGLTKTPAGAIAGQMAVSGALAYRMDKTMVTEQLHDALVEETQETYGREPTEEEWKEALEKTDTLRSKHALWEAVPEAVGNVAEIKLLGGIFREALGANLGTRFLKNVLSMYGVEVATETETQIGQHNAEVEMGLKPGEELRSLLSWEDQKQSYYEVAPGVFVLMGTLSGSSYAAGKVAGAITGKTDVAGEAEVDPGQQAPEQIAPPPPIPTEPVVPQNENLAPGEAEAFERATRPDTPPQEVAAYVAQQSLTEARLAQEEEIARMRPQPKLTGVDAAALDIERQREGRMLTPEEQAFQDYEPQLPETQRRGEKYAEAIRGDEGQIQEPGPVVEGRQAEGREDLQLETQEQPSYSKTQEGAYREQDETVGVEQQEAGLVEPLETTQLERPSERPTEPVTEAQSAEEIVTEEQAGTIEEHTQLRRIITGAVAQKTDIARELEAQGKPEAAARLRNKAREGELRITEGEEAEVVVNRALAAASPMVTRIRQEITGEMDIQFSKESKTARQDAMREVTVESTVVREATGEAVKIKESAEEAMAGATERKQAYSKLLECLTR